MFLKEFFKYPRSIGAVAPSSRYLADNMLSTINFETAQCIIEYGPGTGAFTEKLLSRVGDNTTVILLEINKSFYSALNKVYKHRQNVIVLNQSAEFVDAIIRKIGINKVDYIISGLPFTSLPKDVSESILLKTKKVLRNRGTFITFQYTLLKKSMFTKYFKKIRIKRTLLNFPPAYVLECRN